MRKILNLNLIIIIKVYSASQLLDNLLNNKSYNKRLSINANKVKINNFKIQKLKIQQY